MRLRPTEVGESEEEVIVHILKHGEALCGTVSGVPHDWPPEHKWVSFEDADGIVRARANLCAPCGEAHVGGIDFLAELGKLSSNIAASAAPASILAANAELNFGKSGGYMALVLAARILERRFSLLGEKVGGGPEPQRRTFADFMREALDEAVDKVPTLMEGMLAQTEAVFTKQRDLKSFLQKANDRIEMAQAQERERARAGKVPEA